MLLSIFLGYRYDDASFKGALGTLNSRLRKQEKKAICFSNHIHLKERSCGWMGVILKILTSTFQTL